MKRQILKRGHAETLKSFVLSVQFVPTSTPMKSKTTKQLVQDQSERVKQFTTAQEIKAFIEEIGCATQQRWNKAVAAIHHGRRLRPFHRRRFNSRNDRNGSRRGHHCWRGDLRFEPFQLPGQQRDFLLQPCVPLLEPLQFRTFLFVHKLFVPCWPDNYRDTNWTPATGN